MALIEIDGLPIKNGDFPWQTVKEPEGISHQYPYIIYPLIYPIV